MRRKKLQGWHHKASTTIVVAFSCNTWPGESWFDTFGKEEKKREFKEQNINFVCGSRS